MNYVFNNNYQFIGVFSDSCSYYSPLLKQQKSQFRYWDPLKYIQITNKWEGDDRKVKKLIINYNK